MKAFLAVLLFCASAFAQKVDANLPHAKATLTAEQCATDARLWREPKSVDSATYSVLLAESDEMNACLKLAKNDVAQQWLYLLTDDVLAIAERDRLQSFMVRRGNPVEFAQEDAAGVR
jgi:hypothetical protein